MEALGAFVIPVTSLRMGHNELEFSADWRFFEHFEDSPVEQGLFVIRVDFDRHSDHWHLEFTISGHMDTECDRCLAPISLPVEGSYELFVRFEDGGAEDEDADVVAVPRETTRFDISQFVYEYIVLSVPIIRRFDCEELNPQPCDTAMLARLLEKQELEGGDSMWEVLKDIPLSEEGRENI